MQNLFMPFMHSLHSLHLFHSQRFMHFMRYLLSPPVGLRTFQLFSALLLCLSMGLSATAGAQALPPGDPGILLDSARTSMESIRSGLRDGLDDAQLLVLRNQALSAQVQSDTAAKTLAPMLADVLARLAELGAPAAGLKEAPEVAAQRSQLVKTQTALDSQIKLARLLSVEAEQTADTVWAQRRSQFSARLSEQTHPILGKAFWVELAEDLPADLTRLARLGGELQTVTAKVLPGLWVVMAAATALLLALRSSLHRYLPHLSSTRVPPGRLRRSLHAFGIVLVSTLTPGLIAHTLFMGLTWDGTVAKPTQALLASLDAIIWFGGFVVGLGQALLLPAKPSWRLPPISDAAANSLRWFPLQFSAVIVLGWMASILSSAVNASLATTVALKCIPALVMGLTLGFALLRFRQAQKKALVETQGDTDNPPGELLWISGGRVLVWTLLGASLLALLLGYVALGGFAINQLVWSTIVLGSAYLLAVLSDDLFMTLLAPTPEPDSAGADAADVTRLAKLAGTAGGPVKTGKPAERSPGTTPVHRTRAQTAVLLSAFFRVLIVVFALMLLLAPYGEGPLDLIRRASRFNEGLSIGEVNIHPAAMLEAALVLVLGLLGVRLLKTWLTDHYMPTTQMDAGMRSSVITLFGYLGAVSVVALSMSAIGIGLERVAWVASALSVGIGFGLQAVVQNFVSGLILLAERPVKVGDWVSLAGIEGDIRRINVRATEIQMGDRSTVIVPNSEFITKIVRNVTHTDPIGLVQIKLPMPLATDAKRAKALLLEAFQAHPGVLDQPEPNVQLDGIDGTNLVFNATGFVSSPRASYGVRSELLFDVLERLRNEGLVLAAPSTLTAATDSGGPLSPPFTERARPASSTQPASTPPITAAVPSGPAAPNKS